MTGMRVVALLGFAAGLLAAQDKPKEDPKTPTEPPCALYFHALVPGHMVLAVRVVGGDKIKQAVRLAQQYWSDTLDIEWKYADTDAECAMKVVEKDLSGFDPDLMGMSDMPELPIFQGVIQIDKDHDDLSVSDLAVLLVHEMGHFFGLMHNENVESVMYAGYDIAGKTLLEDDLKALSVLHRLKRPLYQYRDNDTH